MNNISLMGRLTKKPEAITSGKAVKFTIAVNRAFQKDKTDFINCIAFGKTGDTIAQYHDKGSQIAVTGALQIDKQEKDGKTTYYTTVAVNSFTFVAGDKTDNKKSTDNGNVCTSETNSYDDMPVDDGDIPF